ncbi:MAG: acetyltransferase [Myxococcales bacterium]|nr:acetyltransferase [Myxococcales bacterium]
MSAAVRTEEIQVNRRLRSPGPVLRIASRLRWFWPAWAAMRLQLGRGSRVTGRVWLPGWGQVRIGSRVRLIGDRAAIELRAHEGGEIVIEDDVLVEDGASIEATCSVVVGAGARIGPFCKIIDNHFHPTTGDRHARPEGVPIRIGRGAVLGPRAVVLPGGSLGDGAVLGPAAVLSFRLPPGAAPADPPRGGEVVCR